jgi:beta-glucosidase
MLTYPLFPPNFYFGAATAAYQIEGGWNEEGKGLSTWDKFTHTPGKIHHGETGDIACDTYHDFLTDIHIMASLGLNAYRFSISWARVLPEGRGRVNPKGLDYYNRLVDSLLEHRLTPFITLFHWDMPLALAESFGGFCDRQGAYAFADYVEVIVRSLGDRVKHWITLNEPWEHAMMGHFLGEHAPGKRSPWLYFKVAHHQLLGHGLAVERIRSLSPEAQVGITLSQFPVYPFKATAKDRQAAEFADLFINRFYLDGLFRGAYPEALWKRLWLFKPKILDADMQVISRPIDFLGVNYYSRLFAFHAWFLPFFQAWIERKPPATLLDPELGDAYPRGIYELAMRYRNEYGNPVVYITENGTVHNDILEDGRVHDLPRQRYLEAYLSELARAIRDGADVRGYFVWTLVDDFEWNSGYNCRMGLVYVDHPTQQRTVKDSAYWYRDLIQYQIEGRSND